MDADQLEQALHDRGLDGAALVDRRPRLLSAPATGDNCLVTHPLSDHPGEWVVYFSERGSAHDPQRFAGESAACREVYWRARSTAHFASATTRSELQAIAADESPDVAYLKQTMVDQGLLAARPDGYELPQPTTAAALRACVSRHGFDASYVVRTEPGGGPLPDAATCLRPAADGRWEVVFAELGEEFGRRTFATEADACCHVYALLMDDVRFGTYRP